MSLDTVYINVLAPNTFKVKSYFKETFKRFGSEPVLKLLFYYDYYKYRLDENFFIYRVQISLALPKVYLFFIFFSGVFFLLNLLFPAFILLALGLAQAVFYVPKIWQYATLKGLKRKLDSPDIKLLSDKEALSIIFNEIN